MFRMMCNIAEDLSWCASRPFKAPDSSRIFAQHPTFLLLLRLSCHFVLLFLQLQEEIDPETGLDTVEASVNFSSLHLERRKRTPPFAWWARVPEPMRVAPLTRVALSDANVLCSRLFQMLVTFCLL